MRLFPSRLQLNKAVRWTVNRDSELKNMSEALTEAAKRFPVPRGDISREMQRRSVACRAQKPQSPVVKAPPIAAPEVKDPRGDVQLPLFTFSLEKHSLKRSQNALY